MTDLRYTSQGLSLDERERRLEERERLFDEKVAKTLEYLTSAIQELSSEFSQTKDISVTPLSQAVFGEPESNNLSRKVELKDSLSPEEKSYVDGYTFLKHFYNKDSFCQKNVPMSRNAFIRFQSSENKMKEDINYGAFLFNSNSSAFADGGQRFVDALKDAIGDIDAIEVRLQSKLNEELSEVAVNELEQIPDMQETQGRTIRP